MSTASLRLSGLATLIPQGRRTVAECISAAGGTAMDAKVFSRLFGIDRVAVLPDDHDPSALFGALLDEVLAARAPDAPMPDTLIHVHGNPVQPGMGGRLITTLRDRHTGLAGLRLSYEMDQQNCSTLFWALAAAGQLIAAGQAQSVLILAGDIMASLPASERYAPGCTAIGDAAAAMLVDGRSGGVRLYPPYLATMPQHASGRFGTPPGVHAFNAGHTGFVKRILSALGSDGPGCQRPILAHNVNRLSWAKFIKDTGTDPVRIRTDLLPDVGHCYTLDALLMVPRLLADGGDEADLLSVGQGGFLAGCRIIHERGGGYVHS